MPRAAFLLSLLTLAAASLPVPGGSSPSRMMANVYLLAHAGAILDICRASPESRSFPEDKARDLAGLSTRLEDLVRSIATHYGDAGLHAIYASTKAEMAADTKLRFHVKNNHQNCGERLMGEMKGYVAQNEALIGKFLDRERLPVK